MAKATRIAITLLSCVSLSILGTAGAASAHPRHAGPTKVAVHVHKTTHKMKSNKEDWCC